MSPRLRRPRPLVVAADDDWEALGRMASMMWEFDVISVQTWPRLENAVERFRPDVVLLGDTLQYPRVTAEKMVEHLYADLKTRVIVLSEFVAPDQAARWRERGAIDCLLHPTKVHGRMRELVRRMLGLDADRPIHGTKR